MNKIVICSNMDRTEATIDISELQKDKYVALLTDYKTYRIVVTRHWKGRGGDSKQTR